MAKNEPNNGKYENATFQAATKSVLIGSVFSFLGIVISNLGGIALRIVLARLLTREEFGRVAAGLAVLVTVSIISLLGFDNGVSRFTAYYSGKGQAWNVKAIVMTALKITVPAGLFAGTLVYLFAPEIAHNVFGDREMVAVLRIFAVIVPFYMVTKILNAGMRGLKKIGPMVLSERIIWRSLPLILFPALFIFTGMRTNAAGYSFLITVFVMLGFSIVLLTLNMPFGNEIKGSEKIAKKLTRFSMPLALVNVTNDLKTRTPIFILGFFLGVSEIALFSVSMTLASLLNIFLATVVTIFGPVASELQSQQKTADLARLFSLTVKWILILIFPITLFLVCYSKGVVTLIFGSEYAAAGVSLAMLAMCFFFKSVVGPTGATLLAMGKSRTIMYVNILTVMWNIILNIILIPWYGVFGAAMATGTAMVFQQLAMLCMLKRHISFRLFKLKILFYLLYCLVLIAFTRAFVVTAVESKYVLAAVSASFYAACLAGLWITGQLDEEDYELLGRVCNRAKRRPAGY